MEVVAGKIWMVSRQDAGLKQGPHKILASLTTITSVNVGWNGFAGEVKACNFLTGRARVGVLTMGKKRVRG